MFHRLPPSAWYSTSNSPLRTTVRTFFFIIWRKTWNRLPLRLSSRDSIT